MILFVRPLTEIMEGIIDHLRFPLSGRYHKSRLLSGRDQRASQQVIKVN